MVFDPARLAFETVWSDCAWDHLSARLFALPVEWRFFLKHEIFAAVSADTAAEADPVAAIERAYARLLQLHPQIAPRTHGEAA
jgi:N-methylhydantoinase B